ncbi:hypothetical protein G4B88_021556 [Cannabis sativa]|uniref:Protein kinase domain-containing protein n=1 Tax=Cannabis sativa TaxID=3483 RepID=A0A7J6GIU1_CANSA|nr:hypothetical protein G4B88_021556 [Cannabis sativa]
MTEKEDTCSPTGVLEDYFRSSDSETCSSKEPTNGSESHKNPKLRSRWHGFMQLLRTRSKKPLNTMHTLNVLNLSRRMSGKNLIGKGGYAEVYKGCLRNGQLVAIKKLTRGKPEETTANFLSEIGIMAHVNHPNTAKLIGYGVEGGMHLLSLLVQICDFGLAKWLPEQWTHHTVSKFEGTFGYLAPEYLLHGIVDEKTDVFAYGVLLLELVTGRRALDYSNQSLVLWAKPLLKKSESRELVDPSLADDYNSRQVNLVLLAATLCIQPSSIRRPTMSQVLELLHGDFSCLKNVKKTRISFFRKASREELTNTEGQKTKPGIG